MFLPSAAGAQSRLCRWLPRTDCWDSALSASSFSPPQPTLPLPSEWQPISSPNSSVQTASAPFPGLSPRALAWQDPNPAITSTYFLSHAVPWSSFRKPTHGRSLTSITCVCVAHLGVSAQPAPSVSHPCRSQLYRPSKVRDGKCVPRACSDHLAVLPCWDGFCGHTCFQWKRKGSQTSLVVQWLRLQTPNAGVWVQSLVRELDPTCHS